MSRIRLSLNYFLLSCAMFMVVAPGSAAAADCPCVSPVVSYPSIETFQTRSLCQLDGLQCSTPCPISPAGTWSNVTSDDLDWSVGQGGTPTDLTGPLVDATQGNAAGRYAYTESSCPDIGHSDKAAILYSKCFNFSSIVAPELTYAYHMFGEETGSIRVEVSTNSCASWTPIDIIDGPQQDSSGAAWKTRLVNMIQFAGASNVRIRLVGTTGRDQFSDMAIDDIKVQQALSNDLALTEILTPVSRCGLGETEPVTVRIENIGYGAQTNFDVSYQIDGGGTVTETFEGVLPGGSSIDYTFTTPADMSGGGDHTILAYVQPDARSFNDSVEKTVTFVPTIDAYPYTQDFESGNGGWTSSGINSTWAFGTPAKTVIQGAASGQSAWTTGGLGITRYRNSEHSQVLGPCFDFTDLRFPVVSMKAWWNAEGGWDGAVLQSSINGGQTWQRVGNFNDSGNWYNSATIVGQPGGQSIGWSGSASDPAGQDSHGWVTSGHVLSGLGGSADVRFRIAFGTDPNIRDDGFAFDDFVIREGSTATKTAQLLVDVNGNGRADQGDRIRYTINVANTAPVSMTGVFFEDIPDPSSSLVAGSVTTSQGTVTRGNSAGHTYVRVSVGTLSSDATVVIRFNVDVNAPAQGAGPEICNRGSIIGNGFSTFFTDDPVQPGDSDFTCMSAYGDSDGDGVPDGADQCPGFPDYVDADGDGMPDACDGCPADQNKSAPGFCGCGVPETDSDVDGTPNCVDGCPADPAKIAAGVCGCGVPDTDSDGDGTPNCNDDCPADPAKTSPGICGCGVTDTDSDGDGTPNCADGCPSDPLKIQPSLCGCGVADTDSDGDGTPNCLDGCPVDPTKVSPGVCGCGVADTDSDSDGTANCHDNCPADPNKTEAGQCGCGTADTDSDSDGIPDCHDDCPDGQNIDSDGDGVLDCIDGCPNDPTKSVPGICGCGTPDTDSDSDGTPDCNDNCPQDSGKVEPGLCGCGTADTDSDGDSTPNCLDGCPNDPGKTGPGLCGCGVSDTDSDSDGAPNCQDNCPNDPLKLEPGACGCGAVDTDGDSDGVADCNDGCPADPDKSVAGICGCGTPDTDSDSDGTPNCNDNCPSDPGKINPGACGCGTPDTDGDFDGTPDCNDGCLLDPLKLEPGICGCGVPDNDTDEDGVYNCNDGCPADPLKVELGQCGCGVVDTDSDSDGVADCVDLCPFDSEKVEPGICGCGAPDSDSDGDGSVDCVDLCPSDPLKSEAGICGCNVPDTDSDGDGTVDCQDSCPNDGSKTALGVCGCGVPDIDSDGDGAADCVDLCAQDPGKVEPGQCGCGAAEADGNSDGIIDCQDLCPSDPLKVVPGDCGCGVPDGDLNSNGLSDCLVKPEMSGQLNGMLGKVRKLRLPNKINPAQAVLRNSLRQDLLALQNYAQVHSAEISMAKKSRSLSQQLRAIRNSVSAVLKKTTIQGVFNRRKNKAVANLKKLLKSIN